MQLHNDRFLKALAREAVDRPPVWLMRQAGRYLPEYRKIRAEAGNFMALCKNSDWAAEVTLQPLDRFGLDAVIIFSDILTIPDAMGLGLTFAENEGPRFECPVQTAAAVQKVPIVDMEDLAYVPEAIRKTKAGLHGRVPLIGFCGSPWTVATYMVEGKSSRHFSLIKTMAYQAPDVLHALLHKVCQSSIAYLQAQAEAGADALMVFDTWGSVLSTPAYETFSLAYMHAIVQALQRTHPHIPLILFTKGGGLWLEKMAATGCAGLGLDWTIELSDARARIGHQVALQGNLDPILLLAGPEVTARETARLLKSFGKGTGHIFNLGHGILPQTPLESVAALVETVHKGVPI